jgi:hypothetical protein
MTMIRNRTQYCRTISIAPGRGIHAFTVREACRVEYLGEHPEPSLDCVA